MNKFLIILILVFSLNAFSDDHAGGLKPSSVTGEFYFFSVTDPVRFVGALDKFDSSACAEKWRNKSGVNVGLYSLAGSKHSHMILVTYDGYDNNEKGRIIFGSCPESAEMIKSFSASSDTSKNYNYSTQLVLEAGDWTTDTVFTNIEIQVESGKEETFLKSWKKLMVSQDFPGSYGINRLVFGNKYYTHMIFAGSKSMKELVESSYDLYASDAYKEYLTEVSEIRGKFYTKLVQFVKAYPAER